MRKAKLLALLTASALSVGLLMGCAEVNTVPEETQEEESTVSSDVEDVIEPIANVQDYSTLSTESNGYGQGVNFDDLNRPMGALDFNEEYGEYNAEAIQDTEEKTIMLTFDQGYENGYTATILDTLAEKGVKATFFVVYDYAVRNPELVQRMIDEGHTVGSHSWHHYSMPELSADEMTEEIMYLHDYMIENFGLQMTLFRPPKGEYSELSLAVTGDLGYETVLWSFAYADWDVDNQPDPEESLKKLIDRAHPGAIYLLHSVSETNAEILGDFIDAMLEEGYSFVS
ncbi:MAG: polysaccharide deacetylase family protein [Oscillospiraceae bacterium]|nr:polysaccharide deacetylase family protein [Oscillospiraceae bacterium]